MQQSEETTAAEKAKKGVKGITPELQQAMFTLYENVGWCINEINKINTYISSLQAPQQSQPYYPVEPVEEPPLPVNPNVPTFTKRPASAISKVEEPEKTIKKPWYRQKGIIFAIILAIVVIYLVYVMYMKSTGHTITIPGLGKF
jgi:hypothetical protein